MKTFIISRTDKIGDVVLTIPLAGFIKENFPNSKVIFLGRKYTKPIIDCSIYIDEFADWDKLNDLSFRKRIKAFKKFNADTIIHVYPNFKIAEVAFFAGIKNRIATTRRAYHYLYANKLVKLSRKKSELHEAQLNIKLLTLANKSLSLPEKNKLPAYYGFEKFKALKPDLESVIDKTRFNLILHPKSKGSAREWGIDKYAELVNKLPISKYNIIIGGTHDEAREMEQFLKLYKNRFVDLTGKLDLAEYISLISKADALVACSTGPLHIAAATKICAIGLYAPMKPIYPQRWAPIGANSSFLVKDGNCNKCKNTSFCECIQSISSNDVIVKLEAYYDKLQLS